MCCAAYPLAGCSQPYVNRERLDKGLVVVLSGVGGRNAGPSWICDGLDGGGVDCAIEIFDWVSPWGMLDTLQNENRNRRQADRAASRIAAYQNDYPARPTYVVGQSAGGGLAIWVAEAMPEGHILDRVIVLAPAISPDYDLSAALTNTREGIVNFHSELDWVILCLGTSTFGTIDGRLTESAGRMGFTGEAMAHATADSPPLVQVPWTADMVRYGHVGGHNTSGTPWYVANVVAPYLMETAPDVRQSRR
jgi:pimeloyl-ACP methyl ester carboxylesterase